MFTIFGIVFQSWKMQFLHILEPPKNDPKLNQYLPCYTYTINIMWMTNYLPVPLYYKKRKKKTNELLTLYCYLVLCFHTHFGYCFDTRYSAVSDKIPMTFDWDTDLISSSNSNLNCIIRRKKKEKKNKETHKRTFC